MTTLYVKNMVCNRCIKAVANILHSMNIIHEQILLGEIKLQKEPGDAEKAVFQSRLQEEGFELIDDKKTRIIEQIKRLIIERVATELNETTNNLSDYLSAKLHLDYAYLSSLFSSIEGFTIEKYYIAQKIERAKELLVYGELSLSEIAFRLGYSSTQYLSNQFKKVTGLTPSYFKQVGAEKRKPLDQVA
jgi:AraC family transcriptional regulator